MVGGFREKPDGSIENLVIAIDSSRNPLLAAPEIALPDTSSSVETALVIREEMTEARLKTVLSQCRSDYDESHYDEFCGVLRSIGGLFNPVEKVFYPEVQDILISAYEQGGQFALVLSRKFNVMCNRGGLSAGSRERFSVIVNLVTSMILHRSIPDCAHFVNVLISRDVDYEALIIAVHEFIEAQPSSGL